MNYIKNLENYLTQVISSFIFYFQISIFYLDLIFIFRVIFLSLSPTKYLIYFSEKFYWQNVIIIILCFIINSVRY